MDGVATKDMRENGLVECQQEGSTRGEDEDSVGSQSFFEEESVAEKQDLVVKKDTKRVNCVKVFITIFMISVAGLVAQGVHFYINYTEIDSFQDEYKSSKDRVFESLGELFGRSLGAVDNFMVNMVSEAKLDGDEWPFVHARDFAIHSSKLFSLSKYSIIGVFPRVSKEQRSSWEQWATENDGWIDESITFQKNDPVFSSIGDVEWTPSSSITGFDGPLPRDAPGPFFPAWYTAPVFPHGSAYNQDLHEAFGEALDDMESQRRAVMGRTLNLNLENGESSASSNRQYQANEWIKTIINLDAINEPLVEIFYPIINNAASSVSVVDEGVNDHEVVGALTLTFYWNEVFSNILAKGEDGLMAVVGNDCGQVFTYQLFGPVARYLGPGDLHGAEYAEEERDMNELKYLHELTNQTSSYTGFPLSETLCPYYVHLYASDEMKENHQTSMPLIFMALTLLVFIFAALVFKVYDHVVERRYRNVFELANQSAAIVTHLFPKVVRDKLFGDEADDSKKQGRLETAKMRVQQFLGGDDSEAEDEAADGGAADKQNGPIAELFTETTVLFADLVGFTAWASSREPGAVFTLLENVYGRFDKLAVRRGVFKVETIGDSYMAVTGLPNARKDHAVAMCKFARDIREAMDDMTTELSRTLGPDTDEIELRIGLNSGPVTAGVLRGDKSRFQLFGDTVNTASRMESTGVRSKIQASQSTADELKKSGKGHWLSKRKGGVQAKGKGTMPSWFVEPSSHGASSTCSSVESLDEFDGDELDAKTMRLIEWNVQIMSKMIKHIIIRREARRSIPQGRRSVHGTEYEGGNAGEACGTVLEEVQEVVQLPEFDSRLVAHQQDPNKIELSQEVMVQLHEFVSMIALMYKKNPFHNFEHASHVTMSVVKLLSRIVSPTDQHCRTNKDGNVELALTLHDHTFGITSDPLTQFACVFSALIHDVDHQGVPNSQLVLEGSPLISLYKGKSLAEQNSVDLSWDLYMQDQFEDLRKVITATESEMDHFRHLVVNSVMATDIMDKDLKALRNARWEKAFSEGSRLGESKQTNINRKATIVIEHLIQASDVAHTMQHWHIYRKWNENLFKEMYYAYKAGRSEKNPAEFWYKGEMGFFDFYIIPLARKLKECGVFGVSSDEYLSYAMKNREEWERRGQETVAGMVQKLEPAHIEDIPDDGLHEEEK